MFPEIDPDTLNIALGSRFFTKYYVREVFV